MFQKTLLWGLVFSGFSLFYFLFSMALIGTSPIAILLLIICFSVVSTKYVYKYLESMEKDKD